MLLASVSAAVVSQAGLGSAPAFRVPTYSLASPFELPLFLLFGTLCGAVSSIATYSTEVCCILAAIRLSASLSSSHTAVCIPLLE